MKTYIEIEGQQDREELVKILAFNGYSTYVKYDKLLNKFFIVIDPNKQLD